MLFGQGPLAHLCTPGGFEVGRLLDWDFWGWVFFFYIFGLATATCTCPAFATYYSFRHFPRLPATLSTHSFAKNSLSISRCWGLRS